MRGEAQLDFILILLLGISAALAFFSVLGVIQAVSWLCGGAN